MRWSICQKVRIVDLNGEIIREELFEHERNIDIPHLTVGCSVVTYPLGLKGFDIVYDKRKGDSVRSRVVDIEINLVNLPSVTRVYLEPTELIVGQHDIGEYGS